MAQEKRNHQEMFVAARILWRSWCAEYADANVTGHRLLSHLQLRFWTEGMGRVGQRGQDDLFDHISESCNATTIRVYGHAARGSQRLLTNAAMLPRLEQGQNLVLGE